MNGRHGWRLLGSGGNASVRILRDCCLAWALCDCDVIFGSNELTWIDKCRSSLMRYMKIGFGIRFFSRFFFCLLHFGVWTAFNLNLEQYLQLLVVPQDWNRHVGVLRRRIVEKPLKTTRPSLLSWSCDLRTLSITRLMDVSSCTSWEGDTTIVIWHEMNYVHGNLSPPWRNQIPTIAVNIHGFKAYGVGFCHWWASGVSRF